jgi:hypothetical protein
MGFFRFVALVLLLGLLAWGGVSIYNAGVTAGIAADVGSAIASGAPIPVGYYPGPYIGQPWGHGFGFGSLLLGIFVVFLFFGLLRAAFGGSRWDGHHAERGGWTSHHDRRRDFLDAWHRERHAEGPEAPAADKA